jgi:hypothetical protein
MVYRIDEAQARHGQATRLANVRRHYLDFYTLDNDKFTPTSVL